MNTFTGRRGAFEVKVGDAVVHSMLASGIYPDAEAIEQAVTMARSAN